MSLWLGKALLSAARELDGCGVAVHLIYINTVVPCGLRCRDGLRLIIQNQSESHGIDRVRFPAVGDRRLCSQRGGDRENMIGVEIRPDLEWNIQTRATSGNRDAARNRESGIVGCKLKWGVAR